MHSDGVLWQILPDLIDVGLDVIQPIDSTCMDIINVKKEYGEQLCMVANVPN